MGGEGMGYGERCELYKADESHTHTPVGNYTLYVKPSAISQISMYI